MYYAMTYRFADQFEGVHQNFECFFSSRLVIFVRMNQERLTFIIFFYVVVRTVRCNAQNTVNVK